jgi:hypothetical protein
MVARMITLAHFSVPAAIMAPIFTPRQQGQF